MAVVNLFADLFPDEDEEEEEVAIPFVESEPLDVAPEPEAVADGPVDLFDLGFQDGEDSEPAPVEAPAPLPEPEEEPGFFDSAKEFVGGRVQGAIASGREFAAGIAEKPFEAQKNFMAQIFDVDPEEVESSVAGFNVDQFADEQRDAAALNREKQVESTPENAVGRFMTGVADSIINMGPSIAVGRITKNGDAGLAIMGGMVYTQELAKSMEEGNTREQAEKDAALAVLFEIGPEKAFGFFDKLGVGKGFRDIAKQALREAPSETYTEALTIADEKYRKGLDVGGVEDVVARVAEATAAGFFVGGGIATADQLASTSKSRAEAEARLDDQLSARAAAVARESLNPDRAQRTVTEIEPEQIPTTPEAIEEYLPEIDTSAARDGKPVTLGEIGEAANEPIEDQLAAPVIKPADVVDLPATPDKFDDAVSRRSLDRVNGELRLPDQSEATPENAAPMIARAKADAVERAERRARLDALPDDASVEDVRKAEGIADSRSVDKRTAIAQIDAQTENSDQFIADLESLGTAPIKLFRGRRNQGGTKKDFGGGTFFTEDPDIAQEKYAKNEAGTGTVAESEFTPQSTLDVADLDALAPAERTQKLAELDEWLAENNYKQEDSYVRDVLTGKAQYVEKDGTADSDFAFPKKADVEWLRSQGYDNVRYEKEGGERVASRFVLDEVKGAPVYPEGTSGTIEENGNQVQLSVEGLDNVDNGITGTFYPEENKTTVDVSYLEEGARGTGTGTAMYTQFIQDQQRRGRSVETGGSVTDAAMNVWKSLESRGYPVEIATNLEEFAGTDGVKSVLTTDGTPVVRVTGDFAEVVPNNVASLGEARLAKAREGTRPLDNSVQEAYELNQQVEAQITEEFGEDDQTPAANKRRTALQKQAMKGNENPALAITHPSKHDATLTWISTKPIEKEGVDVPAPRETAPRPLEQQVMLEAGPVMEQVAPGQAEEIKLASGTDIVATRRDDGFTWAIKGEAANPQGTNYGHIPIEQVESAEPTALELAGQRGSTEGLVDQPLPPGPTGPGGTGGSSGNGPGGNGRSGGPVSEFQNFVLMDRARKSILHDPSLTSKERRRQLVQSGALHTRQQLQDKMVPLLKIQRAVIASGGTVEEWMDAVAREELISGKVGTIFQEFEDDVMEPLSRRMDQYGISRWQLSRYLFLRHAPSRNERVAEVNPEMPDGGSGMMTEDALDEMGELEATSNTGHYEELAAMVDSITVQTAQNYANYGLIKQEVIDSWAPGQGEFQRTYVGLKGFAENDEAEFAGSGTGFDVRGAEVKRALGRTSESSDILGNVVADYRSSVIRGEKNEVGKAFLALVKANPNKNLWILNETRSSLRLDKDTKQAKTVHDLKMDDPNVIVVKVNGKAERVTIKSPSLAAALKNVGVDNMGAVMRNVGTATRYLSLTRTMLSPEFFITNFGRDIQTAFLHMQGEQGAEFRRRALGKNVNESRKFLGSAMKALYLDSQGKSHSDPELAAQVRALKRAGGTVDFFREKSVEDYARDIDKMVNRVGSTPKAKVKQAAHETYRFIDSLNASVENAARLRAFIAAKEMGLSDQAAAGIAKNLTVNFNKRGLAGPKINAAYMFANATAQSVVRGAQAIKNPKIRKYLYMIAASGAASVFYNELAGGDDDDGESFYSKIPDYVKERNAIVMIPPYLTEQLSGMPGFESIDGKNGAKGLYFKLVLPYIYSIAYTTGAELASVAAFGKDPVEAAVATMLSINNSINPLGSDSFISAIVPSLADPIADVWMNRNFFGGTIYDEGSKFDSPPVPDSEQGRASTNAGYIATAKYINKATFGDSIESGGIDVHPESLRYWLEYGTGGTGQFVERLQDNLSEAWSGNFDPTKTVYTRKFIGKAQDFQDSNRFYRNKEVLNIMDKKRDELEEQADAGEIGESRVKEWYSEHKKVVRSGLFGDLKSTEKRLSKMRKRRNVLRELPKTERNEKQLERIEKEMLDAQVEFNKNYNKTMLDRGFLREWLEMD